MQWNAVHAEYSFLDCMVYHTLILYKTTYTSDRDTVHTTDESSLSINVQP